MALNGVLVFAFGLIVMSSYSYTHPKTCKKVEHAVSDVYYVHTSLGRNNRKSILVGDQPELDKYIKQNGILDQDSTSDFIDARSRGIRRLYGYEVPKIYYLHERLKRSLSDIFCITGGVFVVSERLRQILEELDPGLHQYFPIDIIQTNGDPVEGDYFVLHITVTKDIVFMDQPAVKVRHYGDIEVRRLSTMMAPIEPIMVTNDGMGEAGHIWHAKYFERYYFISKALHDRMVEDDIYFFKTYKTKRLCEGGLFYTKTSP